MASAEDYARWIVANQDKKGSQEFETVAQAYKAAKGGPEKPGALQQGLADLGAGAIRGAGSIGATLLTPIDALARAAGVQNSVIGRTDRRQAMDEALSGLGYNTDSLPFQFGKLTTEVGGTAGAGGALGQMAAKVAPQVVSKFPALLEAITTSGMKAGGLTGASGLGVRALGGGITGGAAAGLVNPEDAGTGAAVSAALPAVLQGAGKAGRAVGASFKSREQRAAETIAKALEQDPALVAQQLQAARAIVPGSEPTVAQALRTPQASILERVVSESAGGAGLKQRYASQNAARQALLDAVAPVDPRGVRSVQEDFGAAALKAIREGDEAARGRTRAAYQAIPQDEAALYLPDLAGIRDEFFPSGAFGGRQAADTAVDVAQKIGMVEVPAIKPLPAKAGAVRSLAQAVRQEGGIKIGGGLGGEAQAMRGEFKNIIRNNGKTLDELAETMYQRGYILDENADTLIEALKAEARGGRSLSGFESSDDALRAMSESMMGDLPGATVAPQKVTLGQFDALRKSIGNAQRAAARDPERATEAAALSKMKSALDDRIDEVVRGDGGFDENLPIAWADQLDEARKLKRAQVEKFRTGPQAEAFRTGADNMPKVQGGEFAGKVWGQRAGIADDIKQFRKVMDDNPALLGQFKSMVTTEASRTATNTDQLTGKFVRWVENSLPGLKASFSDREVKMLQRIAADIKRAEVATKAGAAVGSNTYQNASNALNLGLLDSPLLNMAANRVPLVNQVSGPALEWFRTSARDKLAGDLAGLLGNPKKAAEVIGLLGQPQAVNPSALELGLLRAMPALVADR